MATSKKNKPATNGQKKSSTKNKPKQVLRKMPDTKLEREWVENQQLHDLISNAVTTRAAFIRDSLDKRRSVNTECGYEEINNLVARDFKLMYDEEGTAERIVQVEPMETWKVLPKLVEDDDPSTTIRVTWNYAPC